MANFARLLLLFIGYLIYYAIAINEPRVQAARAKASNACLQQKQEDYRDTHQGNLPDAATSTELAQLCK